jgi:hypothetical protein
METWLVGLAPPLFREKSEENELIIMEHNLVSAGFVCMLVRACEGWTQDVDLD